MQSIVTLVFGTLEVSIPLPATEPAWTPEAGRLWLDEQFVANGCVPLRASGKLLNADRLYSIADAVGEHGFMHAEAFRLAFAQAALAVLRRPQVRIDVDARTLSY